MTITTTRRTFLIGATAASSSLFIGLNASKSWAATTTETELNPFVKIDADGTVTAIIKHFEMGQGTTTGLTTLIAEELDADWENIQVQFAPANAKIYANLAFGAQGTGGSTAIANSFIQYRKAGATARDVLVKAAAQKWGVETASITVENSILKSGEKSAHFGEVLEIARTITPPAEPKLKSKINFKLIGKETLRRKDSEAKTNGTAVFAMDVKVPGMVYCCVARPQNFGALVKSFDKSDASKIGGFIDARTLPNNAGVAVYAKNTWAAKQARDALRVEWDLSKAETRSTKQLEEAHADLVKKPEFKATKNTDFERTDKMLQNAAKVIEGDFFVPFLAHEPMEPLNCVIEPTPTGVRVHDGCQFPSITKPTVAAVLGLKPEQVEINTVYAGGSFGRRATTTSDYHLEASLAFVAFGGTTPVKLVWMREDQLAGGYYRPMAKHKIRAGLDGDGKLQCWDHRVATKSIIKGSPFEGALVHDGVDHTSVEGIADTHYAIHDFSVGLSDLQSPVPVLWWRSVGHTHTAFAMETMMDMVAREAGKDPIAFRKELLSNGTKDQKRLLGVLEMAASKAGWEKELPKNHGRGIAVHKSFNSYVAEVAEISVAEDGSIKVERITCAVDCGIAVNPDVIKAQMESGIGYGLGAMMRNQITLSDGVVDQVNFPDYEPIRMSDFPDIDVHIIQSDENPTGVGEPGLPPVAPAVVNAIFDATGKRYTSLPLTEQGIEFT
ncbi:MAG: xanthine dehydrogenase family protein molybdopterin-binding subunit [Sneathiellales bacterium]|nr:xanthine dehydrogenase family protein molybdopterin-binding subunit [Sneathiellales bacterium]